MPKVVNAKAIEPRGKKIGDRAPKLQEPNVTLINEVYRDERAATVDAARAELGESAVGMSFCYRRATEKAEYLQRMGYVPCKHPTTGEQYSHGGDPLFMRPSKISEREGEAASQLAQAQLRSAMTGADPTYKQVDADGNTHSLVE